MEAVVYSNFRNNMKTYFKQVNETYEPLIVVNKNPDENVVVVSKAEWDNLLENLYVANNTYLSDKIKRGMKELEAGKGVVRELFEDEDE